MDDARPGAREICAGAGEVHLGQVDPLGSCTRTLPLDLRDLREREREDLFGLLLLPTNNSSTRSIRRQIVVLIACLLGAIKSGFVSSFLMMIIFDDHELES